MPDVYGGNIGFSHHNKKCGLDQLTGRWAADKQACLC
jgi:hypothetical protein